MSAIIIIQSGFFKTLFFMIDRLSAFPYIRRTDIENIPVWQYTVITSFSEELRILYSSIKSYTFRMICFVPILDFKVVDFSSYILCKYIKPCSMRYDP